MPFVIVGLFLIFAISFLIGKLLTPKDTPFKVVLQKGFLKFLIVSVVIIALAGAVALVDNYLDNRRWKQEQAKEKEEEAKRIALIPELKKQTPKPTVEELKTVLINWNFPDYSMPCLSTYHPLDFETLSDIKSIKLGESQTADNIYEVKVNGDFHTNKPESNFDFIAEMTFQYVFENDSKYEKEVGWKLRKIIINKCSQN